MEAFHFDFFTRTWLLSLVGRASARAASIHFLLCRSRPQLRTSAPPPLRSLRASSADIPDKQPHDSSHFYVHVTLRASCGGVKTCVASTCVALEHVFGPREFDTRTVAEVHSRNLEAMKASAKVRACLGVFQCLTARAVESLARETSECAPPIDAAAPFTLYALAQKLEEHARLDVAVYEKHSIPVRVQVAKPTARGRSAALRWGAHTIYGVRGQVHPVHTGKCRDPADPSWVLLPTDREKTWDDVFPLTVTVNSVLERAAAAAATAAKRARRIEFTAEEEDALKAFLASRLSLSRSAC